MVAEIETLLDALASVRQDAPGVAAGLSEAQFNQRPSPAQWSVGECFEHLNLTGATYLPALDAVMERARNEGLTSQGPFAYGWFERWMIGNIDAPPRRRFRAPGNLAPAKNVTRDEVMKRFDDLQEHIADRLRRADGLDLRRIKVRSPIGPISFTLGTTFNIVIAHERRHVWQAREARRLLSL